MDRISDSDITPINYLQELYDNYIEPEKIEYSISDKDIELYLGKKASKNIIKYSELSKYNNINEILKNDKDYKIILIETKYNYGHWVCILRYGDTIEYFNSYGFAPSYDLDIINNNVNNELGQNEKWLNIIFDNSKQYNIIYNKLKFQEKIDGINTCGKHILFRIICLKKFDMNLQQYQNLMKYFSNKYNKSFDELVAIFIP